MAEAASIVPRDRVRRVAVACVLAMTGCKPAAGAAPPVVDEPQAVSAPVTLDVEQMLATIRNLASDELGGRYSLHEDIERAAQYLSIRLADAGLHPAGEGFWHEFTLEAGVEAGAPPSLRLRALGRGPAGEVEDGDFVPLVRSPSGSVSGEVVFVGYGVRTRDDSPQRYDDLEGVELGGKVALVLHGLPGKPDFRALARALGGIEREFETAVAAVSVDTAAQAELQRSARERAVQLISPYVSVDAIPPAWLQSPPDPSRIDLDPFLELAFRGDGQVVFDEGAGASQAKLERLAAAGAEAAIFVLGPNSLLGEQARAEDALPPLDRPRGAGALPIPAVQLKWKVADRVFRVGNKPLSKLQEQIDRTKKPLSRSLGVEAEIEVDLRTIERKVPNVVAVLPGTDLAHEIVLLGAHYDHIGTAEPGHGFCVPKERDGQRDAICNGADDNASGTAVVVEVARALARRGAAPRRTLVFVLFAGEELGLHGSRYFAEHLPNVPPFTDGRIVAMINIDMVGRLGPQGLFVGGLGSSPTWMPLLDEIGPQGVPTLYERSTTSRSDHASFYRREIPVLFFFTGVHDDYHAPGDEIGAIHREGLLAIGTVVLGLVERLARGVPISFTPAATPEEGLVGRLPGDNPATIEKRVGFAEP